jgi:hypothetical protein
VFVLLASLFATGFVVFRVATGAQAFNVTMGSDAFSLVFDELHGTGYTTYVVKTQQAGQKGNPETTMAGIQGAKLRNLCMSAKVGGMFVKITGGAKNSTDQSKWASASNLQMDMTDLVAESVNLDTNVHINRDASTLELTAPGPNEKPDAGTFGLQAKIVTILNGKTDKAQFIAAGSFQLPNMRLSLVSTGCTTEDLK